MSWGAALADASCSRASCFCEGLGFGCDGFGTWGAHVAVSAGGTGAAGDAALLVVSSAGTALASTAAALTAGGVT